MIPAPFAGGCPAAIDRLAWLAFARGAFGALELSPTAAHVIAVAPIVLVIAAAAWAWQTRRASAAVLAAMAALFVHPPLLLALAPVLLAALRLTPFDRAAAVRLVVMAVATGAALASSASCATSDTGDLRMLTIESLRVLRAWTGVIAPLLAVFETVRSPASPHVRLSWAVFACSVLAVAVLQMFDARLTLIPAIASIWLLAVRAAASLVRTQRSVAARIATAAFLALVPFLHAAAASAGADDNRNLPTVRAIADALEVVTPPAAIVRESALHDLALRWRRSAAPLTNRLQALDATDRRLPEILARDAVFAFASGARHLQDRGVVLGPLASASAMPLLWQALTSIDCTTLSPVWRDITPLARFGQMSGVFTRGATGRHALIYATFAREPAISRVEWPPLAQEGLRLATYALGDDVRRTAFHRGALADDFPITYVPADASVLARIVLGRMESTPGALVVAFDSIPQRVYARLDTGTATDPLVLCASARDLIAVAYANAPAEAAIDLRSPASVGAGWHAPEREDAVRFRWMAAPRAEMRFFAPRATAIELTLDVLERHGGGRRDADGVTINGSAAECIEAGDSCSWQLPASAVTTGLNTIVLAASAPLKVRAARLRAPSVSRMR